MSQESLSSSDSSSSEVESVKDPESDQHFVRQTDPEIEICNLMLDTAKKPVVCGRDFKMHVNVKGLNPEQIVVRIGPDKKSVIVEALKVEKVDPKDVTVTNVARKFIVPDSCDVNKMTSKLNNDVLIIRVPRKAGEEELEEEIK